MRSAVALSLVLFCVSEVSADGGTHRFVRDIVLDEGTVQILCCDSAGQPCAGSLVELYSGERLIASVVADSEGRAEVRGLRAGAHWVKQENEIVAVRFWHRETAPPAAVDGLVISSGSVLRYQGCTESEKVGYLQTGCLQSLVSPTGIVLAGTIVGITLISIPDDHNAGGAGPVPVPIPPPPPVSP